jgi:hypothetical protein
LESNSLNSFLKLNHLTNKMYMLSHVAAIVISVFQQVENVTPKELGGPQAPRSEDPNFLLEQGKP